MQRITKCSSEIRLGVINSYVQHDLLDISSADRNKLALLEALYCPQKTCHILQVSHARNFYRCLQKIDGAVKTVLITQIGVWYE